MRYKSGLIIAHAEHAKQGPNIYKRTEGGGWGGLNEYHLKLERLTQLCIFGSKVGLTIFTAFNPNLTPKFHFLFVHFDKEILKMSHSTFRIKTTWHNLIIGILLYKPLLIFNTLQNIHSSRISPNGSLALVLALFHEETLI